jgi:heme O synthase-like polyprenyltransferase
MAIASMYREDYAQAGYRIFPGNNENRFLTWMTIFPSFILFIVGIVTVAESRGGVLQYVTTVALGCSLLFNAVRLVVLQSRITARQLLKATILYLPLQFLIFILGKRS